MKCHQIVWWKNHMFEQSSPQIGSFPTPNYRGTKKTRQIFGVKPRFSCHFPWFSILWVIPPFWSLFSVFFSHPQVPATWWERRWQRSADIHVTSRASSWQPSKRAPFPKKNIGSIGLAYSPTWLVDLYGECRYKYTIDGFYGNGMVTFQDLLMVMLNLPQCMISSKQIMSLDTLWSSLEFRFSGSQKHWGLGVWPPFWNATDL